MKRIINRLTGDYLSIEEARNLCALLKRLGVTCVEHRSVYGYPTSAIAEKANLRAVCETYQGYTFAYAGTEHIPLEGYKVLVMAIKELPPAFEKHFPNRVVVGE